MRLLFILFIIVQLTNCKPSFEKISDDNNLKLEFSDKAVIFDTLFTQIGSITKRFIVYNPNKNALNISNITVGGREKSPFDITILGEKSKRFKDINILGKDSLLVLVTANIKTKEALIHLAFDSLVFETNTNLQNVKLVAWGEKTIFLENHTLTTDETWTKENAYLIKGELTVPKDTKLSIMDSSRIYFYDKTSSIKVVGDLEVIGKKDKPVFFAGFRREMSYKDGLGLWKGIALVEEASSKIEFAEIRNATTAISIEKERLSSTADLTIKNTSIKHHSKHGIHAINAHIILENVLIGNCVGHAFNAVQGGKYNFKHCTIGAFEYKYNRASPAVVFGSENNNALNVNIQNSIFWGNKENEILFKGVDFNNKPSFLTLNLSSNLLKTTVQGLLINNSISENPLFESETFTDFSLQSASPAINIGSDIGITIDIRGNTRDIAPDLGCYELIEEEE